MGRMCGQFIFFGLDFLNWQDLLIAQIFVFHTNNSIGFSSKYGFQGEKTLKKITTKFNI